MKAKSLAERFQVFIGLLIGLSTSLSVVYIAHKTFFLSDVKASFDQRYAQKKDLEMIIAEVKNVDEKVEKVDTRVQEVGVDVKDILKMRLK